MIFLFLVTALKRFFISDLIDVFQSSRKFLD
jgi:hypothetical protein